MGDPIGLIRLHPRPRMFQECFAAGQNGFVARSRNGDHAPSLNGRRPRRPGGLGATGFSVDANVVLAVAGLRVANSPGLLDAAFRLAVVLSCFGSLVR